MHNLFRLIIFTLTMGGLSAHARCEEKAEKEVAAVFEIVSISDAKFYCYLDENGNSVGAKPITFKQSGCNLELEVQSIKGKKNRLALKSKQRISIYDAGKLCSKKVGEKISKYVVSTDLECCLEKEKAMLSSTETDKSTRCRSNLLQL